MKPEEIKLTDIQRILFGEVPASFYLEAIFRALVIYIILMVSMRLMGKRMSANMNRNEMAAMVSLAAAIGIPLMNPDRGIIPPVIVSFVLIAYQMYIAKRATYDQKFEAFSQGTHATLVAEGKLKLDVMKESRISRERLYAQLRSSQIRQLGEIKRFYLEASGTFTLIRNEKPEPGLIILPEWDHDFIARMTRFPDRHVCHHCGNTARYKTDKLRCTACNNNDWTNAVL